MQKHGGVLLTVRDSDKAEIAGIAEKFTRCGFSLCATPGTAGVLAGKGFTVQVVKKIHECHDSNTATFLESGKISYILSTSEKGRNPALDEVKIRRRACVLGIPCLTAIDTANALADSLLSGYSETNTELVDSNHLRKKRMKIPFTKMSGCVNDYILIDCFDLVLSAPESLAVLLSDRHTGVGGDGIVLVQRSDVADAKMRVFNRDGNEEKMCGNAIRCVGKYLYDNGMVVKPDLYIETRSGVKALHVFTQNGQVSVVRVNMGQAELAPDKILKQRVVAAPVTISSTEYTITCVSMGSPHMVVFCEDIDRLNLDKAGPLLEKEALFPDGTDVEFVQPIGENHWKMRAWKHGSGETPAYGTGACASAVAAVLNGYCEAESDIKMRLLGGELIINCTDEAVYMTGACKKQFEGTVEI